MTTMAERLARLAALEEKLKVRRRPRLYVRLDGGSWLGAGPPDGVPRPEDTVLDVVFVEPTHGGRPPVPEGERLIMRGFIEAPPRNEAQADLVAASARGSCATAATSSSNSPK